jgi:cellulose synthase/poly-beta-1,6-N-acetylglucosamine synthase-like glycosyltransferase
MPHTEDDEVFRDRLNAAWCPGSGFILRLEALLEVGGFPESSIAEDVLLGWILQGRGWRTVYVNERLQWGLQPDSLDGHIRQRIKWVSCSGLSYE